MFGESRSRQFSGIITIMKTSEWSSKRRRAVAIALTLFPAMLVGGVAVAVAPSFSPTDNAQIVCAPDAPLVVYPNGTWQCGTAPTPTGTPSATNTPTPTTSTTTPPVTTPPATEEPTPTPTTTTPAPTTPVPTTPTPTTPSPTSTSGWPSATNTGVPTGIQLTVRQGDLRLSTAGQIVEGLDIRGCVDITAANVVLRNSKVRCTSGFGAIESWGKGGVLIENVEVDCGNTGVTGIGFSGASGSIATVRKAHIYGCENGFDTPSNILIEDSYVHGLWHGNDGHTDAIQIPDNSQNITVRHNRLVNDDPRGDAAIIGDTGTHTNVLIQGNILASAGGYIMRCPNNGGSNYRLVDNRFFKVPAQGAIYWGPYTNVCRSVSVHTGNVWDDTGQPVSGL